MSESTYKIKTKEVEPKLYSILFVNRETRQQVIKTILAYTFEDAVGTGRMWISNALGVSLPEALKFEPSMYESINAKSMIEFIVDGEEKVLSDTNAILQKIVEATSKEEAEKLLKKYRPQLSEASVKYAKEHISKKI